VPASFLRLISVLSVGFYVVAIAGPGNGGKYEIPTGADPSPMFGVKDFTQRLLRFEEFGTQRLASSTARSKVGLPVPRGLEHGLDAEKLDAFLASPLDPPPRRLANVEGWNPWGNQIAEALGRSLQQAPAEGRPPGEAFAHQRWNEFPPRVYFKTATTGARENRGLRDEMQMHRFQLGEFGPGGLYHSEGTSRGVEVRLHPQLPVQHVDAVWTFDGTLPPKLLQARYGEAILFRHYNALPIDPAANYGFGLHTLSTHEHNGHNPFESDGYTQSFFFPGQYYDYRWPMILAGHDSINVRASDLRAGAPDGEGGISPVRGDYRETMSTHWFHDHMIDYTAQNVYKGSVAMMNYYSAIDRGNESLQDGVNLRLPSGSALDWGNRDYDVNLVIADKAWDEDGQLFFNIFDLDGFLGDRMTVNWLYKPFFEVRARRYRLRILNGSVARYLKIALVDDAGTPVPFYMIANDGNIMEHAVYFEDGVLPAQAVAERYDIVVDFRDFEEGDRLYFVNLLEHRDGRGPKEAIGLREVIRGKYDGDPAVGKFLEFRVKAYGGTDQSLDPSGYIEGQQKLLPLPTFTSEELAKARHRTFEFGRSNGTDSAPWTIKTDGGPGMGMDPTSVSAAPAIDSVEIWHLESSSGGWSHPVHIHFEEAQILRKDERRPPAWERWSRKDVFRLGPGDDSAHEIEVAIRFREFGGTYMEHCHNTQHEDHAMLLRWDIERPGQLVSMATPMPEWEGCGYIETDKLPTARDGSRSAANAFRVPRASSVLDQDEDSDEDSEDSLERSRIDSNAEPEERTRAQNRKLRKKARAERRARRKAGR